ncbi:MAG: hypothetical protein H6983_25115 [Ectothiorhodospiraceae bacterium]|nr:hypothetical protein [Chromatiales bacterium]MCP5157480.1 hypothetical protein [Ectothiorhodospiraceae bacterium]
MLGVLPVALLRALLVSLALAAGAGTCVAQTSIDREELEGLLAVKARTVQHLALNPVLVRAVRRQNAERLTMETIRARDSQWTSTTELTDFKRALQESEAGRFLRRFVERSPSFNEAFLTDEQGANVAAYPATSDYWQGDEEKWSASFRGGDGRVFFGPIELDESTKAYAAQISAPVLDRERTIGVLVVGVTLTYVEAKRR